MKTGLRAEVCATKGNRSNSEKGIIRRKIKEYKGMSRKDLVMVEFNVWKAALTN